MFAIHIPTVVQFSEDSIICKSTINILKEILMMPYLNFDVVQWDPLIRLVCYSDNGK